MGWRKRCGGEAAMPTQEALPQECGFGENEKGNCKLSKERSGMDNLQFAKANRLQVTWSKE